ncbi:hypothetical protein JQ604_02950 [Bradyrhizobium jicamae]|uniref:hypothetical protein n=1 Tax=Bradyrhizobium jicamae TaxID=280332 RepID=UPI001BA57AA2|nr:hypothetical protein [Bradyrhizobium jicamae]MBR0751127.1 hypothetical protein [Bradyrhizobium jicamae]
MTTRMKDGDERLARTVGLRWQTAAEVQRTFGGVTHEIAEALDRLWKAGRLERDAREINIGVGRKGGGRKLRLIRYRGRE